jgi:NTE family protein
MTNGSPSTTFVLAGGGSLGAVEVGMLEALVAAGVGPDRIVGSSVGAINAAHFAGAPDADGVRELRRIWTRLRRRDVFPLSPLSLLGLFWRDHLIDAGSLRRLVERSLAYSDLSEAVVPLDVVATDVLSGTEVVLSEGPVVDAVLASAAIPAVFPPVELQGHLLVDGGVANNTPISVAVERGAERVIVLPTGFSCHLTEPPESAIAMALHGMSLLIARQLVVDLDRFADRVELRVVPPLCPLETNPADFSRAAELIDLAASSTRSWLERGGLERFEIPGALRAHPHTPAHATGGTG